jgi:hypothetical protein
MHANPTEGVLPDPVVDAVNLLIPITQSDGVAIGVRQGMHIEDGNARWLGVMTSSDEKETMHEAFVTCGFGIVADAKHGTSRQWLRMNLQTAILWRRMLPS